MEDHAGFLTAAHEPRGHPMAESPNPKTALLVIDMLSGWDFPDADVVLAAATSIAAPLAALARRCRAQRVPVIYANDNHGRWRSDVRQVVAAAIEAGGDGAAIAHLLQPQPEDYIVLKPRHSAFHATPLELLLRHLGTRRLVLTGMSSDQCVLYTAADARMRDYEIVVARDCVATQSDERQRAALLHFEQALGLRTPLSEQIHIGPDAS